MSRDELFASAERVAGLAPRSCERREAVVVPLRARRSALRAGSAGVEAGGRAMVAQIADYLGPRPVASRPVAPRPVAPCLPAVAEPQAPSRHLAGHARELDQLLCRHVEVQLELIAKHAPELAQPVETVLRSLDLLLKLRSR